MAQEMVVADVIAISGHRDHWSQSELYRGLDALRANQYIFGGARGVDTAALEYLGRTQNAAWRTVIVPNEVGHQPAVAREVIARWADEVIELRNTGPDRFQIRNRAMVDRADRLHAFYDFRGRGGTYNAIEYARSIGKPFSTTPVGAVTMPDVRGWTDQQFIEYAEEMRRFGVGKNLAKMLVLAVLRSVGRAVSQAMKEAFRGWGW